MAKLNQAAVTLGAFVVSLFLNIGTSFAQEKAVASTDKVEVKEYVEAKVMAGTVQKMNLKVAQPKKVTVPVQIEPNVKEVFVLQTDERWFPVTISGGSETVPSNQQVNGVPSTSDPEGDCNLLNTGEICSVRLDLSTGDNMAITALLNQIANPAQPNPTIQDFLDADATYTGPGVEPTPEYARLEN